MHAIVDADRKIKLGPELGAEPGDEIVLEKRGEEWMLRVQKMPMGLVRNENGVLVHRGVSPVSPETVLEQLREERMDFLMRGYPSE